MGYIFLLIAWVYRHLSFCGGLRKTCAIARHVIECTMAVQSHLTLVLIESVSMTCNNWSEITLVVSNTVLEIQRFKGRKLPNRNYPIPIFASALEHEVINLLTPSLRVIPFEFRDDPGMCENKSLRDRAFVGKKTTKLDLFVLWRTKGRQTSRSWQ